MRIAIVTDAWSPQVNGVVRTLQAVRAELESDGPRGAGGLARPVPRRCRARPIPRSGSRFAATGGGRARCSRRSARRRSISPPKGRSCLAARRWCLQRDFPFTTAYHTQFPDYVAARTGVNRRMGLALHPLVPRAARRRSWRRRRRSRATLRAHGLTQVARTGAAASISRLFGPTARRDPAIARAARPDDALCRPRRGREEYRGVPARRRIPAARWWSATARRCASARRRSFPTRISSAPAFGDATSPPPMPPPTCSSSPAGPTRSGW